MLVQKFLINLWQEFILLNVIVLVAKFTCTVFILLRKLVLIFIFKHVLLQFISMYHSITICCVYNFAIYFPTSLLLSIILHKTLTIAVSYTILSTWYKRISAYRSFNTGRLCGFHGYYIADVGTTGQNLLTCQAHYWTLHHNVVQSWLLYALLKQYTLHQS